MRICTITCQNADNYGARLQAYALVEYLKRQGHDVRVIDYRPPYMTFKIRRWYWPCRSVKQWAKLILQMRQRCVAIKRHEAFEKFSDTYLPLTRIYDDIDQLRRNPPHADVYIAGSDQIWNTTFANGTDPAFYLDFGEATTKRISYAASFATKNIPQDKEPFVKERLRRFDSISVREASAVSILNSLRVKGRIVLDPVFLLHAEDWDRMITTGRPAENYILVYDFMRSKAIRQIARRLASLRKCKIYSISPNKLNYANKNLLYASPEQFVGYVKYARFVVSNSFHGTAFAMIYKRDFFVVNREDGLNERMADWLGRCNLRERMITASVPDKTLTSPVNYDDVEEFIAKEEFYSKDFLRSGCSY